jgi:hypothetical protein
MKTFLQYITETTSTTPPPPYGEIDGSIKDWAQDKLASGIQWHNDQINLLDHFTDAAVIQRHMDAIKTLRGYMA